MWRRRWWLTQEEILIVGILWRRHHVTSTTLTFCLLLFPRLLCSFPHFLLFLLPQSLFLLPEPFGSTIWLQPLCQYPRYLILYDMKYLSSTSLLLYWNSNGDDFYWVSNVEEETLSDRLILSYTEDSWDKNHPKPILPTKKSRAFNDYVWWTSFACKLKKMQVSYISIQILIWKVLPDKLLVGNFALHLLLQFLFFNKTIARCVCSDQIFFKIWSGKNQVFTNFVQFCILRIRVSSSVSVVSFSSAWNLHSFENLSITSHCKRWKRDMYLSCAIESDSAFNLFLVPCVIGCVYLQGMNKQCLSGKIIPVSFISRSGRRQSAADVNCNISWIQLFSLSANQLIRLSADVNCNLSAGGSLLWTGGKRDLE